MDLWNNFVGQKYGKKSKTRKELFGHLLKALKNGELITDLNDGRKYSSNMDTMSKRLRNGLLFYRSKEIPVSKRDGTGNPG